MNHFIQTMKDALSRFAAGVTIVTTKNNHESFGMTVSAFSSVSLKPPLIAVNLKKDGSTTEAILSTKKFAVNILQANQESISNTFADPEIDQPHRFENMAIKPGELGVPLIIDCMASLECELYKNVLAGDHIIMVGQVMHIAINEEQNKPLLYFNRSYAFDIVR